MTLSKVAIGARAQVSIGEETSFGVAVYPTKRLNFVSESLTNAIDGLVSNSLDAHRAVLAVIRSVSNVSGDVAIEQATNGYGVLYKHALGDEITLTNTDGGVRAQLSADYTAGVATIVLRGSNISPSWPVAGSAKVVSRDSSGNLVQDQFYWTGRSDSTTYTGVTSYGLNTIMGDRVFVCNDSTSTTYTGVYTHYIEAGKTLPVAMTFEVGRDIVFFTYTGCRVNQLEETFNAKEILTGKFSLIGRAEASGADLNANVIPTDTTATLKRGSFLVQDGTALVGFKHAGQAGQYLLQIEQENNITYTGQTITVTGGNIDAVIFGIPAASTGAITKTHKAGNPIAPASSNSEAVLVPPTLDPLSSFQAGIYIDNIFFEVLSASYTLNNNLYADKFQLGDRFRVQIPEQRREVTGSMTVEFDDLLLYRRFVNGVTAALEIRCVNDGALGQIGSTSSYKQKHIIMSKIRYTGTTPNAQGPDMITMDMPFQAIYNTTDDEPEMIMLIVNDVSGETSG